MITILKKNLCNFLKRVVVCSMECLVECMVTLWHTDQRVLLSAGTSLVYQSRISLPQYLMWMKTYQCSKYHNSRRVASLTQKTNSILNYKSNSLITISGTHSSIMEVEPHPRWLIKRQLSQVRRMSLSPTMTLYHKVLT